MSVFSASRFLDRHQFDKLSKPLRFPLTRFAARRVGLDAAEDCVQQGLIAAWNSRDRLRAGFGSDEFARFCAACVKNACRTYLRNLATDCDTSLSPEELLSAIENADVNSLSLPSVQCALYAALREELNALLLRVPLTSLQEACVRQWLQGETQAEIAAYWGVNQSAVSCHIQAAIKKLRAERERSEDAIDPQFGWFFYHCVAAVQKSIYRKPSHGSAPRTGRRKPYKQRADKSLTHSERSALEAKRYEAEAALQREEGVAA